MSIIFQRSPRIKQDLPRQVVEISEPPNKPAKPTFSYVYLIFPIIITLTTVGLYVYMSTSGKFYANSTFFMFSIVSSMMMAFSYIIPFFVYLSHKKKYKAELAEREKKYRNLLQKLREDLEKKEELQRTLLRKWNPTPRECLRKMQRLDSSLWERSPHDPDFLSLRLGNGDVPSTVKVIPPKQDEYERDPLIEEAELLKKDIDMVEDVPVLLPLNKLQVVGVVGDRAFILNSLRNLVIQIVTHHSPDEVKIVSFFSEKEAEHWNWIRWFPHVWDDQRRVRYLASNYEEARELVDHLYEILRRRKRNERRETLTGPELPYWVFIISDPRLVEDEAILPLILKESDQIGVRTILLADSKEVLPMQCQAVLEIREGGGTLRETNYSHKEGEKEQEQLQYIFTEDYVSLEIADLSARALAPVRLKANKSNQIPQILTLFDLVGIKELKELNAIRRWSRNRFPNTLPAAVGMSAGDKKIRLNIHDKIERKGHGPHGLIAGTTGSGKSEVIQSLIAMLALNYHPHDIAFLLIDYKGGGMSNIFEKLPHLAGVITNLDGNLIERAKISLKAELMRREKIFKESGNIQHIDEYYKSGYGNGQPLPHLVIIIDEFAELKKEQPEFMDELISIAAKGRTLGVHLILATQKPSGVVDDKIWSNARFRICLRVQDEADSREMIKIPDAAWITTPGRGYFQVGSNELLELVQFAWSGAPYQPDNSVEAQETSIKEVLLTGRRIDRTQRNFSINRKEERTQKQLNVLVDYLAKQAEEAGIEQIGGPWLPPLPKQLFLEDIRDKKDQGWDGKGWQQADRWLEPKVGLFDDPMNQIQDSLRIPLNEGHLPVYGMPGSGKTTFVQTLLFSLALDHSPDEVHMYVLDFGHMFRDFKNLPHMGAIIRDDEPDRVKRLFRYLNREMIRRREKIVESGAKTFLSYRKSASEPIPAIVVVIDGYLNFKSTFEEEHNHLEQLLRAGGSFGIHFIVTANQITDIFDRVRNNFALGVTMELADPGDYYFAVGRLRKPPVNLPEGRGFVKGNVPPLEFHTAFAAKGTDEIERARMLRQKVQLLSEAWKGNRPQGIGTLPERVELQDLISKHEEDPAPLEPLQVPVAISMDDLIPYYVSLKDGPYFVVGSPVEGGKTSFLQTWILSLAYFYPPEEVEIYLVDFRPGDHGLAFVAGLPHVKGYATEESELADLLKPIEAMLDKRVKPKGLQAVLATGKKEEPKPAILLVIDDADYFSKRMNNYELQNLLNKIAGQGRNKNFYLAISGTPSNFPYSNDGWLAEVKAMETGFLFASLEPNDFSFFKIPISEARAYSTGPIVQTLRAGEGYFAKRRYTKVKGALPFSGKRSPIDWMQIIQQRWSSIRK
ncbi:type VII secretion protein EssC [Thermoactinomyces mirandus]|uniref:Type VII secretion protein EssC n=1 Tax=Thermoactinomyces mirandus TaxID=2756294 RepID=A0A7W1XPT1_9BACL|nr:type VII secretion protein EssC [Thermoactinomyces mirandus]MBA4600989.1 type VII secretion protein EssC [Thermoactinomyces mirandus]